MVNSSCMVWGISITFIRSCNVLRFTKVFDKADALLLFSIRASFQVSTRKVAEHNSRLCIKSKVEVSLRLRILTNSLEGLSLRRNCCGSFGGCSDGFDTTLVG